ncbi:hypothetical protein IAT40_006158 [Kwoniella sp. CBS 6097]
MSRPTPNSSYMPDPNGWIETAPPSSSSRSKTHTRKPTQQQQQRPLLSFSHGLVTPISSGYKKPSNTPLATASKTSAGAGAGPGPNTLLARRRGLENDTPTNHVTCANASGRANASASASGSVRKTGQGTLNNFFKTPPTTGSSLRRSKLRPSSTLSNDKGMGKDKEKDVIVERKNSHLRTPLSMMRGSPGSVAQTEPKPEPVRRGLVFERPNKQKNTDKGKGKGGTRIKVYKDDFWNSSSSDSDPEKEEEDDQEHVGRLPRLSQRRKLGIAHPENMGKAAEKLGRISSKTIDLAMDNTSPRHNRTVSHPLRNGETSSPPPVLSPSHMRTPIPPVHPNTRGSRPITRKTPSSPPLGADTSPPPPITPVPPHIFANHLQLCGRDPAEAKNLHVSWNKHRDPKTKGSPGSKSKDDRTVGVEGDGDFVDAGTKKRKRVTGVDAKDEVDRRVWEAAHIKRHLTPPSGAKNKDHHHDAKKLVDLSSSDTVDPDPNFNPNNKEKKLVDLTSSDPIEEEGQQPHFSLKKAKVDHAHASTNSIRGPLTPIKRNTNTTAPLGKTISSSMIGRRSPSGGKSRNRTSTPTSAQKKNDKKKQERALAPAAAVLATGLPRTSVRQASTTDIPLTRTPNPDQVVSRSKSPSPLPLPHHHAPEGADAQDRVVDIENQIEDVIEEARENEQRLERSLRRLGKEASASQASQEQRQKQKQKGGSQWDRPVSPSPAPAPAQSLSPSPVAGNHGVLSPVHIGLNEYEHEPTSSPHLLVTPKKSRQRERERERHDETKRHQITPPKPKSRFPFKAMTDRQETLFEFPALPPKPEFKSSPPPEEGGGRHWKVAEMQPETLITWGLGEPSLNVGSPQMQDDENMMQVVEKEKEKEKDFEGSQSPESPLFSDRESSPVLGGDGARRPSLDQKWSSKSIEPTAYSQVFPVLIPTSPMSEKEATPPRARPQPAPRQRQTALPLQPQLGAAIASDDPPSRSRQDQGGESEHTPVRATGKAKWDHLSRGILASTPSTALRERDCHQTPSSQPSKKRKSTPTSASAAASSGRVKSGQQSQSKLAAFGFFGDPTPRSSASAKRRKRQADDGGFGKGWEDEEDHHFAEDDDGLMPSGYAADVQGAEGPATEGDKNGNGKGKGQEKVKVWGKVPDTPYHPALRPAGIRELERRAKAAATAASAPVKAATRGDFSSSPTRPVVIRPSDDAQAHVQPSDGDGEESMTPLSVRNRRFRSMFPEADVDIDIDVEIEDDDENEREDEGPLFEPLDEAIPHHHHHHHQHQHHDSSQLSSGSRRSSHSDARHSMTTSSSQSGHDEGDGSGVRTPGSTRAWWDGLDTRRGSEFGTME